MRRHNLFQQITLQQTGEPSRVRLRFRLVVVVFVFVVFGIVFSDVFSGFAREALHRRVSLFKRFVDVGVVPERLDGVGRVLQVGEGDAVSPKRALVRNCLGRLVVRLERLRGGGALHAPAEQLVRVALRLSLGVARVRPQRREGREDARAPTPRAQAQSARRRRLLLGGGERGAQRRHAKTRRRGE